MESVLCRGYAADVQTHVSSLVLHSSTPSAVLTHSFLSCFGKVKFPRGVIGEDGKQFVKGVSLVSSRLHSLTDNRPLPSSSIATRNTA